eukprot:TRINITY_DN987_c0_g1_i1.p1 TRINITY_DN987_c0_g1~~TRINITY_DN987_c0_g1_i1.p1  ORF type:complete len:236 (-),score=32.67 TRINITY_DN987_c0_g1_i1:165-872(-)
MHQCNLLQYGCTPYIRPILSWGHTEHRECAANTCAQHLFIFHCAYVCGQTATDVHYACYARPALIKFAFVQVGTQLHELRHPIRRVRFSRTEMQSVELQLTPVAARWQLRDIRAAHQLCGDMLHALSAVHSEGFVHRDVRADNILLSSTSFVLIDWELAGRVDDAVFWQPRSEHVPPGVRQGSKWQTWMDLWQLGRVLEAPVSMLSSAAARDYITKLCNGHFSSAEVALQSLTVW